MANVGRNDPCPCGSGKKYKQCHLPIENAAPAPLTKRALARHEIDQRVVSELTRFARRRFGAAWAPAAVYEELGGSAEDLQLFAPWSVYHCEVGGRPVVDWYLEERGSEIPESERAWLAAQQRARISVWEIADVVPGESIAGRDLFTGEERLIHEVRGSRTLVKRDAVLTRVVDDEGVSVFCGVHHQPLPPREAAGLVRALRRELGVRSRLVPVARLREPGVDRLLITAWELVADELENRPLPQLRNTDGDEILFTIDRFTIASGAQVQVEARLKSLDGVEVSDDDHGVLITFTKPGNKKHKDWENTIIGRADLTGRELKAETNSRRRADELRGRIEQACAGLLTHRIREHVDPQSALERMRASPKSPRAPKPAAEMQLLRQFKETHYEAWVNDPLPALGGATPLEAVQKPRGRREVELLLKELENHESRLPEGERFDVSILRKRLGLEKTSAR